MKFINLKKQNKIIRKNLIKSFNVLMDNSSYIMGSAVTDLEKKLCKFTSSKYCITVSSGTDALLIALMSLNIKPGDEIITTSFTWISTAEVIGLLGAKPVFVDCESETCNINLNLITQKITKKTKAIIGVSLYGQMYDVEKMSKISKRYRIPVIEDGAQSFGAKFKNHKSCNSSLIGCTSFFPTKPLGGYGDGGAIFTNNSKIASACKEIRVHGQKKKNLFVRIGINGRMDPMQCVVINEKLKIFNKELKLRNKVANFYSTELKKIKSENLSLLVKNKNNFNAWAQYTIIIKNNLRNELRAYLNKYNIPTGIYYPIPLNNLKFFKSSDKTPMSQRLSKEVISLPMSPYLLKKDQNKIIKKIKDFFS